METRVLAALTHWVKQRRDDAVKAFPFLAHPPGALIILAAGSMIFVAVARLIQNGTDHLAPSTHPPVATPAVALAGMPIPQPPRHQIEIDSLRLETPAKYYVGPDYEEIGSYAKTLRIMHAGEDIPDAITKTGAAPCYRPSEFVEDAAGILLQTDDVPQDARMRRNRRHAQAILDKADPVFTIVLHNAGNQTEILEGVHLAVVGTEHVGFQGDGNGEIGQPLPIQGALELWVDAKGDGLSNWFENPIVLGPGTYTRVTIEFGVGDDSELYGYVAAWIGHMNLLFAHGRKVSTKDMCVELSIF